MDRRKIISGCWQFWAASAVLLFGFLVAQRLADYYKDSDVVQTSQEDSFYVGDLTLELTTRGLVILSIIVTGWKCTFHREQCTLQRSSGV